MGGNNFRGELVPKKEKLTRRETHFLRKTYLNGRTFQEENTLFLVVESISRDKKKYRENIFL